MSRFESLRKKLMKLVGVDYDDALQKSKLDEIDNLVFMHDDKHYKSLVFNASPLSLDKFDIELEFVDSKNQAQTDLWQYFRVHTSSIKTKRNKGRYTRILVKEKNTQKYVGILSLSSDIYSCEDRDKCIGWEYGMRTDKLKYVTNISTCVGLQPIAHNLNIGKLLVALCYSKEVQEHQLKKYGHYTACYTTFSINGKSIQYDRMKPYLEHVGETKGFGTFHLSDKLIEECTQILRLMNDTRALQLSNKLHRVIKVCDYLDIPIELVKHNHKRGVYIGFVGDKQHVREFLCSRCDDFDPGDFKCVDDISAWWKNRWAVQRLDHLLKTGRLKTKIELINARKLYNIEKTTKSEEKKIEEIGKEEYKKQKREYMQGYRRSTIEVTPPEAATGDSDLDIHWLGGFFDGDGSIHKSGNNIVMEIGQCEPGPLFKIQQAYGGSIHIRRNGGNKRPLFIYTISGLTAEPILIDLHNVCIIDMQKIEACIEFIKCAKVCDEEGMSRCLAVIDEKTKLFSGSKPYTRINDAYISGFFDAEGEVAIRLKPTKSFDRSLKITQKCDMVLLDHINKHLGFGTITGPRFCVYNKSDIIAFVEILSRYCIGKKQQLEYLQSSIIKDIPSDKRQDFVEEFQKTKTASRHVEEALLEQFNKAGKEKARLKKPAGISDQKQKRQAEQNLIRSQRMTGANNPNFNKERKEDHCKKIMQGTLHSHHDKRKITDAMIDEIRSLYDEGKSFEIIAKRFELSRQYVTDIARRKVLKLDEITDEALEKKREIKKQILRDKEKHGENYNSFVREKTAISRRKISAEQILHITQMKLKNKKLTPKQCLDACNEDHPNITIDVIKNYWKGTARLYESEFPLGTFTWGDYTKIVDKMGWDNNATVL